MARRGCSALGLVSGGQHLLALFSSAAPGNSDEALHPMVISAFASLPSILQSMISIGTTLQNLNQIPIPPPQPAQGGAQKPYKTSRDLSDIKYYICGEMGPFLQALIGNSEIEQPRAFQSFIPQGNFWIWRRGTRKACYND